MTLRLSTVLTHLQTPLGCLNMIEPLSHKLNKTEKVDSLYRLLLQHDFLVEIYLNAFEKMLADPKVIMILIKAVQLMDEKAYAFNQGKLF